MKSLKLGIMLALVTSFVLIGFASPVASASSQCKTYTNTATFTNAFGMILWTYTYDNTFCFNGSVVTSRDAPFGMQSTGYFSFWSSRGHSEFYDGGSLGTSFIRLHGTAHFSFQLAWYTLDKYVDIYVYEYGDGSVSVIGAA